MSYAATWPSSGDVDLPDHFLTPASQFTTAVSGGVSPSAPRGTGIKNRLPSALTAYPMPSFVADHSQSAIRRAPAACPAGNGGRPACCGNLMVPLFRSDAVCRCRMLRSLDSKTEIPVKEP
jgi:hypothetical protein